MRNRLYKQRILWNRIAIEIVFEPDWLGAAGTMPHEALAHLQLRSIRPDRVPLPVSETGYRSAFLPAATVYRAGGPVAYARQWLNTEAASPRWQAFQETAGQYILL